MSWRTLRVSRKELQTNLARDSMTLGGYSWPLLLLVGGFFGVMAAVIILMSFLSGNPALALIGVVAAAAWCYPMAFGKSRLTLNFSAHTYAWEHGLYPFIERRAGDLDDFDRLHFGRIEMPGSQGNRYTSWYLRFVPKDGNPANEPPTLLFSDGLSFPERNQIGPPVERLAQKARLPLTDGSAEPPVLREKIAAEAKSKAATSASRPKLSSLAWVGILFGIGLLGFVLWMGLLWRHANRGAHFPVRIGEKIAINHLLRDCRVESFTVTRGPSHTEFQNGEHGTYPVQVAQYTASLDVVSLRPGIKSSVFVVGMGGNGSLTTSDQNVVFSPPGRRQTVTMGAQFPGDGPDFLLLRDTD